MLSVCVHGPRHVLRPGTRPAFAVRQLRALGEPLAGGAWIVRIYFKPFVNWIWGGCLLMALGGALATTDRRYRAKEPQLQQAASAAGTPA